jgi:hypothetical protein
MPDYTLQQCDIVTIYDPARTRESEYGHLARNAVMTTACTPEYDVVVLDYYVGRGSFDEVWQAIKQQTNTYNSRCLGIEDVATQIAIGDAMERLAQAENIELPYIEPLRPDTRINKKFRIRTTLQRIGPKGKLFYQAHHYELRQEWNAFPNGRTVDLLDVLAYGIMLHDIPDEVAFGDYNSRLKQRIYDSSPSVINLDDYRNQSHEDTYSDPRYRVPTMPDGMKIWRYA